ncbi:glycosyl hydrolase family 28-related protein [Streptomyces sp. x-80]|uniref:glycosyl hydrolase family 28-related protein n=1 Tax=Streptomyces sp. x-80 TaxID=2789282 RepID=UPI00397EF556
MAAAAALAVSTASVLAAAAAYAAADTVPGQIDVVAEAGAKGDGTADDTAAVQRAIDAAYHSHRKVYFPGGTYRIDGDLDWSKPASFAGDPDSPAILTSPGNKQLADLAYSNKWDRSPTVDNLVFDGLRINLNGPHKHGLTITRSIFINRMAPDEDPSGGTQQTSTDQQVSVGLQNVRGAQLTNSVFLSARPADGGVPISSYRTRQLRVSGNLLGADLGRLEWLGQWAGGASWSQNPAVRLRAVHDKVQLPDALGHLQRGMSLKLDEDLAVSENIINRDPRSQAKSDHALYVWGFNGALVKDNWVRGWPQDARGGLKIRNGEHATVTGNYLSGTALLLYTYDVSNAPRSFRDIVICDNVYDIRGEDPAPSHNGFMYWKNFSQTGVEEAIAIFNNRFLDDQKGQPDRPDISQSRGDSNAFSAHNNTYADGSTVPVIGMSGAEPSASQVGRCSTSPAPGLSVPSYSSPLF